MKLIYIDTDLGKSFNKYHNTIDTQSFLVIVCIYIYIFSSWKICYILCVWMLGLNVYMCIQCRWSRRQCPQKSVEGELRVSVSHQVGVGNHNVVGLLQVQQVLLKTEPSLQTCVLSSMTTAIYCLMGEKDLNLKTKTKLTTSVVKIS